ncbi:hypothetical protein G5I_10537 [Acromyrmex echinatior]|uniref:Uncharacterized protein n=1 Tax=Acromyrmex echinatior TaxID=103372 RepID=F4WX46_ACREC|nr:hypothetical protein G5I_10537 [Acromyrmex echinatior]
MQNRCIGTVAKSLDEGRRVDINLHEAAVSSSGNYLLGVPWTSLTWTPVRAWEDLSRKKRKKKERETREKGSVIQWIQPEKSVLIQWRDDKPEQNRSIVSVDITCSTRLVVIRYQQLQEEKRNSTLMKVTTASTNDDFG